MLPPGDPEDLLLLAEASYHNIGTIYEDLGLPVSEIRCKCEGPQSQLLAFRYESAAGPNSGLRQTIVLHQCAPGSPAQAAHSSASRLCKGTQLQLLALCCSCARWAQWQPVTVHGWPALLHVLPASCECVMHAHTLTQCTQASARALTGDRLRTVPLYRRPAH